MLLFGRKKKNKVNEKSSAEKIAELLGFPYEIFPKGTPEETIIKSYHDALEKGRAEGFVPVIICNDDVLEEQLEMMLQDGYSANETLQNDMSGGKEFLDKVIAEMGEYDEEFCIEEITGEICGGEVLNRISAFREVLSGKVPETALIKIPTENPWEIPAYIPFGGWNECPAPEDMTMVCKYWYEKYKAVPAAISHDVLEFVLPEPIVKDEAMAVAVEHFAFCEDRVFQCTGTGTIGELADCLSKSTVWYFWWD